MGKILRRVIITAIVLIVCVSAFVYTAFQTPILTRWLIYSSMTRALPEAKIFPIHIGRQSFHFPLQLQLNDFRLELTHEGRHCRFSLLEANLQDLNKIFSAGKGAHLIARDFDIQCTDMTVTGLKLDARLGVKGPYWWIDGDITTGRADLNSFRVAFIQSHLSGDSTTLTFSGITAQGYQGNLTGNLVIDLEPALTFDINMNLDGLDLVELKKFNEAIFSQMEGKLYARIRLKGDTLNLNDLDVKAYLSRETKIKSSLLKSLTPYLPATQRKDLEGLIKQDAMIPVERAVFGLQSVNPRELSGLIQMSMKRMNVQLNAPISIKSDGRWDGLIQAWQKFQREGVLK